MVTLNLVTALSRPKNLQAILMSIKAAYEFQELTVRWVVVYDGGPEIPTELGNAVKQSGQIKIVPLAWGKGPCRFGINQKNFALDHLEHGYYHLLDDDNIIHPDFFRKLVKSFKDYPGKAAYAFHQRRWDQHGDLQALPEKMVPGKIDNTMFVVHTELIGAKRYDLARAGFEDGFFFSELYQKDPSAWVFVGEYATYYNYLGHHKVDAQMPQPTTPVPEIDISIITYRSEAYLPGLLSDLKVTTKLKYNLRVVDNTGNMITLTALWNNLWMEGRSEYVAILNPDIKLSPGWDERLIECLRTRPDVAVALPNRYFPMNGIPDLDHMTRIALDFGKRPSFTDLGEHLEGFYAFMTRRSVLERLKGFDERFRFYFADSDFQLRALRLLGLKTTQVNHCVIGHLGAVSTQEANRLGEIDRQEEFRHAEEVKKQLASGDLRGWDSLGGQERAKVRLDPIYGQLPRKGTILPRRKEEPDMRLVIEDIYAPQGRKALIDAYTKSMWVDKVYHKTVWGGVPALQVPEDLLMISELIWTLKPKLVVECGIWQGGGLLFYASLMDLLDRGEVIGVDVDISRALHVKKHVFGRRIILIQGSSTDPNVTKMIAPKVPGGNVIFILDSNHEASHVRKELELFAPLVPSGSYLIVMDGVMKILHNVPGGEASWNTNNPETALSEFLALHPEFERDMNCNKFGTTHGPGGFLRRK